VRTSAPSFDQFVGAGWQLEIVDASSQLRFVVGLRWRWLRMALFDRTCHNAGRDNRRVLASDIMISMNLALA